MESTFATTDPLYNPLRITSTQGAATADTTTKTPPSNLITVYGIPGEEVQVTIIGEGYIAQSGLKSKTYSLMIGPNGYALCNVCHLTIADLQPIIVEAVSTNRPQESSAQTVSTFKYYQQGTGRFKAINFTSQAPANGTSYCAAFLLIDTEKHSAPEAIQYVDIHIITDNIGLADNGIITREKIEADGTVALKFTSIKAGQLRAYIYLNDSPDGEFIPASFMFTDF